MEAHRAVLRSRTWTAELRAALASQDVEYFRDEDFLDSASSSPKAINAHRAKNHRATVTSFVVSAVIGVAAFAGIYRESRQRATAAIERYAARQPDQSLAPTVDNARAFGSVPSHPPPAPPPPPKPKPEYPVLPLPWTQELHSYTGAPAVAPLSIVTRGADHYYVKVVDVQTNALVLTAFIRASETVELRVPLGLYWVKFACGREWYGERYLFGPDTTFAQADSQLRFQENGEYIEGHTLELFLQPNGNLAMKSITAEDF
jgi:hypothetical protein